MLGRYYEFQILNIYKIKTDELISYSTTFLLIVDSLLYFQLELDKNLGN